MGTGKTSWAIQSMNQNTGKSFCYITPYLDEVQRIKDNTTIDIYDPKHNGTGKLENLNELLASGENVVSTHSLFSRITDETRNLIRQGHYTLILDEVLDVVNIYEITRDDIKLLFDTELISLDENKYIIWNEEKSYPDSRFSDVQILAQNRSLIYVGDTVLIWNFPVSSFELFDHVYILTYMFDGQIMKSYYDYHNVKYEYRSVTNSDGKYTLAPYSPLKEDRMAYSDLINIVQDNRLNVLGNKHNAFSKTWYNTRKKKEKTVLPTLKNNMTNYFKNRLNAKSDTIMWSTFKDYQKQLSDRGRLYTRQLSAAESKLKTKPPELNCFVPCNARATNIYAERYNLAYMVNQFPNPIISQFFSRKGIVLDEDQYALSEMIQWIWRSRIRNMQPINLYIPSSRMRDLLKNWIS